MTHNLFQFYISDNTHLNIFDTIQYWEKNIQIQTCAFILNTLARKLNILSNKIIMRWDTLSKQQTEPNFGIVLSMVKNFVIFQNFQNFFSLRKINNSWAKSEMNMNFQLSLYLIMLYSLEFWYFFKKCLFWGYQGKYVFLLDWFLRTQ